MKNNLLRVVKMTAYYSFLGFILQAFIVNVMLAGSVEGQNLKNIKVSVNVTSVTLEQAFKVIEQKTNLTFGYVREDIPLDSKVTLMLENESLQTILEGLARDYSLVFNRINDHIVVRKAAVQEEAQVIVAETGSIKGRVMDAQTKEPLIGANILIEGTSIGSASNENGDYEITNLTPGDYVLIVKYIGYIEKSESVNIISNLTIVKNFQLQQKAVDINEVVVTGYLTGTEKRKMDTPVSVITAKEIEQVPVRNFQDLFQGFIPGVSSTDYGAGNDFFSSIYVRGGSSISSNQTKVYIDGVEVSLPTYVSSIDQNSIEKIEITRGISATTLYGSDAAGGVIQIFTKKGKSASRLNFDISGGMINSKAVEGTPVFQKYNIDYSASMTGFSYNVGGTYNKSDPIAPTPGSNNYFFSAYAGAQASSEPVVINIITKFSKNLSGTPQRVLFEDPKYPASIRLPYYQQRILQQTTLGTSVKYITTDWWMHNLNVGYDNTIYDNYGTQPRYTSKTDTTISESSSKYETIDIRYSSTILFPEEGTFKSKFTFGVEWADRGEVSFDGKKTEPFGASLSLLGGTATRDRYNYGGYFLQWQPELWDRLFVTAGIRAEYSDLFGSDYGMAVSPRIGAAYNLELGEYLIKPRASYGKGIRAANREAKMGTITATYRYLPNPNIGPETQIGGDLGIDVYGLDGKLNFEATYFSQNALDLIDLVIIDPNPSYSIRQYQNTGEVKNKGAEFALRYTLGDFIISGSYTLTSSKVEKLSPSYTGILKVGDDLTYVPKSAGSLRLVYNFNSLLDLGEGGSISLEMNYRGSWMAYDYLGYYSDRYINTSDYRGSLAAYYGSYDPLTKINMALSFYITNNFELYLNAWNLTNNTSPALINLYVYEGFRLLIGSRISL
jgi:outer membrane receptor protein involved in Fe transport